MAEASARSDFRNLSRAGVAKKRSRTSTRVPSESAAGLIADALPPSTVTAKASAAPVRREATLSRAAAPIAASASPRKPRVRMSSSPPSSFEVQCRSTASARSSRAMPLPSSLTRIRRDATRGGHDLDPAGARVDGVLDQLLDDARRPLDHLAGGDAVDHVLAEAADRHGADSRIRSGRIRRTQLTLPTRSASADHSPSGQTAHRWEVSSRADPTARAPMSRRQNPSGQSIAATPA